MPEKPRILVVGDFNRPDFLDMFNAGKQKLDFYFIEFATKAEVKSEYYKAYGKALFWPDFSDAYDLLNKIKPSKVIFYFIESFNQVALNVACKQLGIKTYHLDHGFLDLERQQKMIASQLPVLKPAISTTIWNRIGIFKNKLKNRLFFNHTLRKTKGPAKDFLQQYFNIRKSNSISETFKLVNTPFRLADEYLCFCPATFEQLVIRDHLPPNHPVQFIGVPIFDIWAKIKPFPELKNYLLFIPQPLVEQGFLGWTEAFEQKFVKELSEVCKNNDFKFLVKLHPYQNQLKWQQFSEQYGLQVISENEMLAIIPETSLIVGFFSTLLLPVAALPHTTLVTFENHPVQSVVPSAFLTNGGVATQVNTVTELEQIIINLDQIQTDQRIHKAAFVQRWLGNFDGRARVRLREILVNK